MQNGGVVTEEENAHLNMDPESINTPPSGGGVKVRFNSIIIS